MVATISRTTSMQTQMKSQLEKPHNTTHHTNMRQVTRTRSDWASDLPSCLAAQNLIEKIKSLLFFSLGFLFQGAAGGPGTGSGAAMWQPDCQSLVTQTPPMSSTGHLFVFGIICYELRKVELIQRLSITKTVCRKLN